MSVISIEVRPAFECPAYTELIVELPNRPGAYWAVTSWRADNSVCGRLAGDLTIEEWFLEWDQTSTKVRGERLATDFERSLLAEAGVEVAEYGKRV